MIDLFSTLIGDLHGMEKTTAKVSPCDVQSSSKFDKSGESNAKLKSCGTEASKSVAREQSKGGKKDSSKSKSDDSDSNFAQLAEIMAAGFRDLKEILSSTEIDDRPYVEEYEEWLLDTFEQESSHDLFDQMNEDLITKDSVGPEVRPSLAALSDKLLTLKLTDTSLKDKQASHLRPKNVDNLKLPQMNKPVWDNLSQFTRIKESKLQNVQKDVLNSAVPVIKVIETLADAKDDLSVLDA